MSLLFDCYKNLKGIFSGSLFMVFFGRNRNMGCWFCVCMFGCVCVKMGVFVCIECIFLLEVLDRLAYKDYYKFF